VLNLEKTVAGQRSERTAPIKTIEPICVEDASWYPGG
jgi:hypothetical protein